MERYTDPKWFVSFIHKLVQRDKENRLLNQKFELSSTNEMVLRNQLIESMMERAIAEI